MTDENQWCVLCERVIKPGDEAVLIKAGHVCGRCWTTVPKRGRSKW